MTAHNRPRNAYGQFIGEDGVPVPQRDIGPDTPAGYPVKEHKQHLTVGKLVDRLVAYNRDLEVLITTRHEGRSVTEPAKHVRLHDKDGCFAVEIVGDHAQSQGLWTNMTPPEHINLADYDGQWCQLGNGDRVFVVEEQAFAVGGRWLGPISDQ